MPRVNWRILALAAGSGLVVWLVIGIVLAGGGAGPPPGSAPITLRNGRVNGNRISTKSWTFSYAKAQMSPDGTFATVWGVKNGVLFKHGKPYLRISAQEVSVNTQDFDFTALGQVHVVEVHPKEGTPRSFDTDLVEWANGTKILSLPHPSFIRSKGELLKVASLNVNFNTNVIHFGKISGGVLAP
jgi:hypothetical protein